MTDEEIKIKEEKIAKEKAIEAEAMKKFWSKFTKRFIGKTTSTADEIFKLKELFNKTLKTFEEAQSKMQTDKSIIENLEDTLAIIIEVERKIENKILTSKDLEDLENRISSLNTVLKDNLTDELKIELKENIDMLETLNIDTIKEKTKSEKEIIDLTEPEEITLKEYLNTHRKTIEELLKSLKKDEKGIAESKEYKEAIEILQYIILNHPLSGSKLEIIRNVSETNNKVEVLLSDKMSWGDEYLKEMLGEDIEDIFHGLLLSPNISEQLGVNITKIHLKNIISEMQNNPNKSKTYSLNVSEVELLDPEFIKILTSTPGLSDRISLEILEYKIPFEEANSDDIRTDKEIRVHNNKVKRVNINIEKLFKGNYDFAIDDFGKGESNEERLTFLLSLQGDLEKKYPDSTSSLVRNVKIDGDLLSIVIVEQYLKDILNGEAFYKYHICKDVATMFKNLKSYLEAEGISLNFDFILPLDETKTEEEQMSQAKEEYEKALLYIEKERILFEVKKKDVCERIGEIAREERVEGIIFEFVSSPEVLEILRKELKENDIEIKDEKLFIQGYIYLSEKQYAILAHIQSYTATKLSEKSSNGIKN